MSLKDGARAGVLPSVCPPICVSIIIKMNIGETSGPITIKFYLKHSLGWSVRLVHSFVGTHEDPHIPL